MNQHFLAMWLAIYAGCALVGILPGAVLAARGGQPAAAVLAVVMALGVAAVFANAAADLW